MRNDCRKEEKTHLVKKKVQLTLFLIPNAKNVPQLPHFKVFFGSEYYFADITKVNSDL